MNDASQDIPTMSNVEVVKHPPTEIPQSPTGTPYNDSPTETEVFMTPELLMLVRIYDVLLALLKATDGQLYEKVDKLHESGDFVSNFISTMPIPEAAVQDAGTPLFDESAERVYDLNDTQ